MYGFIKFFEKLSLTDMEGSASSQKAAHDFIGKVAVAQSVAHDYHRHRSVLR